MPMNVQIRGKKAQLRVSHKLLPKAFFFTFESESEARSYGQQLVALLDRGVVPSELLAAAPKAADDLLIVEVIRAYTQAAPITDSDDQLLTQIMGEVVGLRVSGLTWAWVDRYVHELKLKRHLAPSTIRKRVGALGRVMDWHLRRVTQKDQPMPANPLRLLPRGYSTYSRAEADALAKRDLEPRRDQARDRRLLPDEEARIRAALAGEKREDRERALAVDVEFSMLFELLVHTGLRLREAYRLRVDQIDLARGIIRVEGSKGHRGAAKPRTVPLVPVLRERLQAYLLGRKGLAFSFWDGSDADLKKATARLSARFAVLFDYAKVPDFTEHDLRHEATCRWVEMRSRTRGGWAFSEVEVCRIMGWSDTRMMLRYASLRGEDLAARLA